MYGNIEGLMNHFKLVIEGQKIPPGEVYVAIEGGNGELGFYLVSDGSGRPYRVRVRPPCFFGMAALGEILRGDMVADIITTFGMINMIGGECDRYAAAMLLRSGARRVPRHPDALPRAARGAHADAVARAA